MQYTSKSKPGYAMLLALFCCSIMVHIGSAFFYYTFTTAFFALLTGLLFLDFRKWVFAYTGILTGILILAPAIPRAANHANIEFFICLFFVVLLFMRWAFKTPLPSGQTVNQIFRVTLISFYFMAGFHKLNSGFFTINGNCTTSIAAIFINQFSDKALTLPNYVTRLLQIMTIVIEMIVPFGMLFKKTRIPVVIILACFHFYLSFCGFSNFSAFAAFLITGCVLNLDNDTMPKGLIRGLQYMLFFAIAAVVVTKFAYVGKWIPYKLLLTCFAALYNTGWVIFYIALIKYNRTEAKKHLFSWWHPAIIVATVLWGSQCYIGLSTAGTLTMFSNLVTEKDHSNHFLIDTKKTKIWNFEEDYITIINLPDKCKLSNKKRLKGYSLPLIEFKKSVNGWRKFREPLPFTIIYKGKTLFIPDIKTSKFNDADTKWWHRFLYYRRLNFDGNECLW